MEAVLREQKGDWHIVDVSGRVDTSNAGELDTVLKGLLDAGKTKLVLNLKDMAYTSSGGLRIFLTTLKRAKKEGGDVKLCAMDPNVQKIFKLAGFTKLFTICETEDDAVA